MPSRGPPVVAERVLAEVDGVQVVGTTTTVKGGERLDSVRLVAPLGLLGTARAVLYDVDGTVLWDAATNLLDLNLLSPPSYTLPNNKRPTFNPAEGLPLSLSLAFKSVV